jgi:hypothetical protein
MGTTTTVLVTLNICQQYTTSFNFNLVDNDSPLVLSKISVFSSTSESLPRSRLAAYFTIDKDRRFKIYFLLLLH